MDRWETALNFDGVSSGISLARPLPAMPAGITIEFWALGAANLPQYTSLLYSWTEDDARILNIHLPWINGRIYWDAGRDAQKADDYYDRIDQAAEPGDYKGAWTHWAFVKDVARGEMTVYRGGTLWHREANKIRPIAASSQTRIGEYFNGTQKWVGRLADLRIWEKPCSETEIAQRMGTRLAGKEPGLVGYWPFDRIDAQGSTPDLAGDRPGMVRGVAVVPDDALVVAIAATRRVPAGITTKEEGKSFMRWELSTTGGGTGGRPFTDAGPDVVKLIGFAVRSANLVDAIRSYQLRSDGTKSWGPWHGGAGGGKPLEFVFDDDEKIVNISGQAGNLIDQLSIRTNKKTYGPFGGKGGSPWSVDIDPKDIVGGFCGGEGTGLDRIGVCHGHAETQAANLPGPQPVLEDGARILAVDRHEGHTGSASERNVYRMDAAEEIRVAASSLVFQARGDCSPDTNGTISVSIDGQSWHNVGQWTRTSCEAAAKLDNRHRLPLDKAPTGLSGRSLQARFQYESGNQRLNIYEVRWIEAISVTTPKPPQDVASLSAGGKPKNPERDTPMNPENPGPTKGLADVMKTALDGAVTRTAESMGDGGNSVTDSALSKLSYNSGYTLSYGFLNGLADGVRAALTKVEPPKTDDSAHPTVSAQTITDAIKVRSNTGVPESFLHRDLLVCCGEDRREMLHAIQAVMPGDVPSYRYRCYEFWRYPSFTLVLTGIGTGCLEPLLWEVMDAKTLKDKAARRLVLFGTAGYLSDDKSGCGKVFLVDGAYPAGCAVRLDPADLPVRPNFHGLDRLPNPRAEEISTDHYYAFSPGTDPHKMAAKKSDKSLQDDVTKYWKDGRLIAMETGQFYHFCRCYGDAETQFAAFRGVANLADQFEQQGDNAVNVLRESFRQAVALLKM